MKSARFLLIEMCIDICDVHSTHSINFFAYKFQSKKEGKDQESIQSNVTPEPGYQWESDNFTIRHHNRESRGQLFPSK